MLDGITTSSAMARATGLSRETATRWMRQVEARLESRLLGDAPSSIEGELPRGPRKRHTAAVYSGRPEPPPRGVGHQEHIDRLVGHNPAQLLPLAPVVVDGDVERLVGARGQQGVP